MRSLSLKSIHYCYSLPSLCRYDFLAREAEVAALEALTTDDVRAWWVHNLAAASPHRRKLSVHVAPIKPCAAAGDAGEKTAETDVAAVGQNPAAGVPVELVPDLDEFKRQAQLHPWKANALPVLVK